MKLLGERRRRRVFGPVAVRSATPLERWADFQRHRDGARGRQVQRTWGGRSSEKCYQECNLLPRNCHAEFSVFIIEKYNS